MLDDLSLKTSDGKEISAAYKPNGCLRFGDYWVHPETVFFLYISLLKGEREIHFSTAGGPFMGDSKGLTALLNPENQVLRLGDYQLPIPEFEKFMAYVFKGDLREVPIQPHGDKVTMIPEYMPKLLEQILLTGLGKQLD